MEGMLVARAASVREQVAAAIREAITDLRFKPGDLLVERQLCQATGASRASVREALRQLESEGLVVSTPGRGTCVAGLQRDDALHLYELRAVLEGIAARFFAQRASDEEQDALAAAVASIRAERTDVLAMLHAKQDFYDVLFKGARNPELYKVLAGLHRRIALLRAASLSVQGRAEQSVQELEEIVKAVRSRDAELAGRLCIQHVQAAARAWASALDLDDASTGGAPGNEQPTDSDTIDAVRLIGTVLNHPLS
jgi:DNA-binding GntR family transcriptional regulator